MFEVMVGRQEGMPDTDQAAVKPPDVALSGARDDFPASEH